MPESNVSNNGELFRALAQWLDKRFAKQKEVASSRKFNRAANIYMNNEESGLDQLKYYASQLFTGGRMGTIKLLEYITKLANVGLIDNVILRKLEEVYKNANNDEKKIVQWMKKHPTTWSYLSYYLTIALIGTMTWGGVKINDAVKDKSKDNPKDKKEIVVNPEPNKDDEKTIIYAPENNDEETIEDNDNGKNDDIGIKPNKTYDLTQPDFINNFVEENWTEIVISVLEMETYRLTPKLQPGESRYTYGPGLTWVYTRDKTGNIVQHPCTGEWKTKADKFTVEDHFKQLKMHLLYKTECMHQIKNKAIANGLDKLTKEQIMGLLIAAYQLPADASPIIKNIAAAGNNVQKQIDAFQYYKGKSKWKNGTLKRRWWCAMYYIGKINANDLYKLNRDAFAEANINTLLSRGHYKKDAATIKYALALTRNTSTVEEFIKKYNILDGEIKIDNSKPKPIESEEIDDPSMAEMILGLEAYKSADYNSAIKHYKKAMEINPDNIEAYSSLSVSYKKQGDKYMNAKNWDSAKDCYEKCCRAVKDGAARVNANRESLQEDLTIKSSLYYNAGQARDALGDIYKYKNDYGTAIRNYDLASKNYQTAIDNATMMEMDDNVISIYQNAKSKSLSKKSDLQKKEKAKQASVKQKKVKVKTAVGKSKNKKAAFTMATIKLKQAHSVVGVIDTSHEYNA